MSREVIRIVNRMTAGLRGRVRGMIRRAAIGTLNVTGKLQTLQVKSTADDVDDAVELFEQYGFTSGPPAGSEGLVLRVGGERAHSVAIAFGNRSTRPAGIEQGEVAVYHQGGAHVTMRNDGSIEVFPAPGQKVKLGGEGGPAVARATDPIALDSAMMAWLTAVDQLLFNDEAPGGPVVTIAHVPPVAPPLGLGTITAGGQGSTST